MNKLLGFAILFSVQTSLFAQDNDDTVFTVVEQMPLMPECENLSTEGEKNKCTQVKIFENLDKNLKYPFWAKLWGVEGTVFITFVVDKDGSLTDVEIIRGLEKDKGIHRKALKAVKSLPRFIPGKQSGSPVKVRYNLPLKFSLNK